MKTRNIFLLALSAIFAAACHTWDEPSAEAGMESYGNQYIQETNVVTIAALKTQYKSVISDNGLQQITKPTQIKVIVTGNDEGSNLYKQLYVSDGTGSLYMSIDKSGIFSEAAVGQCMLIELEGLYIGAYGKQPEIGTFYHNDSKNMDQVGRMSRYTWQDHFKLIPPIEGLSAKPVMLSSMQSLNMDKDCGKLVTLVGVKMKGADGKITFAPGDGSAQLVGGCVNRDIEGMSNVVVRTSTYAKYAAMIMPTEKINITGIAARYNDTWQIMPRTQDDITLTTGNEDVDPYVEETIGTKEEPITVAKAIELINSYEDGGSSPMAAIVKGKISKIDKFDESHKSITYWISDDGGTSNQVQVYSGKGLNGADFTSQNDIKVGQTVIVKGTLKKYVSKAGKMTPEIDMSSEILSITDGEGGGDSGDAQTVSIADFNAAAESTDTWYQITGTIKNLKDGDQYGNFDIEDATGSVYVYGLLAEKGGEKKKFQELVAAKGIANGKKITIIGNRSSYNGKIQVANAYFVKIEDGEGGGDSGSGGDVQTVTVAQFNAVAVSTDVWYQLTGTISNLNDGDQYGNFDITDETGSVYVYGLLSEKGGAKKKFQELVAAKGIANGKKITIIGNRGDYQGKIEVVNAYFVSIE